MLYKNIPKITGQAMSYLLGICLLFTGGNALATMTKQFSQRPDVKSFIERMVKLHDFNQQSLQQLLDNVTIQDEVLQSIANPAEAKDWSYYKRLFLTDGRVEQEYGVPTGIITAILGVETCYGKFQGKYPVLNTLATLAFQYPPRSHYFTRELEQYLLLTRENNIDPTTLRGSYAGAIGQPQFMPSSYRYYAVDYSGNERKDLLTSKPDVVASIGNYLKANGWKKQQAIATPATISGSDYKKLPSNIAKPKLTIKKLERYGVKPNKEFKPEDKASFIILNPKTAPEYWVGFQNFYAITRYNPSVNYAMIVYQLSNTIDQLRNLSPKDRKPILAKLHEQALLKNSKC